MALVLGRLTVAESSYYTGEAGLAEFWRILNEAYPDKLPAVEMEEFVCQKEGCGYRQERQSPEQGQHCL